MYAPFTAELVECEFGKDLHRLILNKIVNVTGEKWSENLPAMVSLRRCYGDIDPVT